MRVLLLVQKEERAQLDTLYGSIAKHCDLDLRKLSSKEQADLATYFKKNVNTEEFGRIIFFLRFKKEIRQVPFIRTIPNLIILEHDAWQNYYADSKYKGKFSRHYFDLPWARILVSGASLCKKLVKEGHDAVFIPKGYDNKSLTNLNRPRNIELGFLGSIEHKTYIKRKQFLDGVTNDLGLEVRRTNSGDEYLQALNNIKYFISADIDFGENMIKNFEAMACGCVVFAYNQGETENNALHFKDMENIVLYQSLDELKEKLALLKANEALSQSIAAKGQALAEEHYGFSKLGKKIVEAIMPNLRKHTGSGLFDNFRYLLRR
ncbi:glycosyltransferase [Gammaproteobacteria bacterium 45_16_T64]|nr:glycosyltransferase [Gammaproteobacteria bacterium 45_16_T64]